MSKRELRELYLSQDNGSWPGHKAAFIMRAVGVDARGVEARREDRRKVGKKGGLISHGEKYVRVVIWSSLGIEVVKREWLVNGQQLLTRCRTLVLRQNNSRVTCV